MAIDDNTSYELTGYQVKDLAQKIRAKADSSSLASVATSGLYSDLTGTPSIPTVYNGTLTITQGGNSLGTFTANSSTDVTIDVPAGGSSYTAGTGIDITNDVISTDLTAGSNIQINGATISATDTTYSDFTGATSSVAGAHGLVPAPAAGDDTKFLSGDGTWQSLNYTETVNYTLASFSPGDYPNGLIFKNGQRVGGVDVYHDFWNGKRVLFNNEYVVVNAHDLDEGTKLFTIVSYTNHDWQNHKIDGKIYLAEISDSAGQYAGSDHLNVTTTQEKLTAGSNITISGDTISATDTTYSNFTGATASVAGAAGLVPAPSAGDQGKALHGDGTWKDTTAKLVEMSYGESNAWAKFLAAYNAGSIVYCRASSNSNPGSGAKTRKAFMAYVNNEDNPTSVEFQYVRSVSSKTDSQQTDQVFVYTLTNASGGTWSVASRNMGSKINVSGPITKTFTSGANATITIGANAMTGATASTAGAAGVVPAPASGDNEKFLRGDGTWQAVGGGGGGATTFYWFSSFDPGTGTSHYDLFTDDGHTVVASDSDVFNAFNAGGALIYDENAGVINAVISMGFTGESFITIDANGTEEYSYNGIPLPGGAAWTRS